MDLKAISEIYKNIHDEKMNGSSYGQLALKYQKSRSSIQRIVESLSRPKHKRGRKPKISRMDKYHMKIEISKCEKDGIPVTSAYIRRKLLLNASNRTVSRSLKSIHLKYQRLFGKYVLSKIGRQTRISITRSYIENRIDWTKVVFTDEKYFTLVGNDSYYTWKSKGINYFKARNFLKSTGIMIWGALFYNGTLSFRIVSGTINSEKYIEILKTSLIPMTKLNASHDFVLQQDNCRVHTSHKTKNFLDESGIKSLDWAPYSPDLNIIENVWSEISKEVYSSGNIKNLNELKAKVKDAINKFNEVKLSYVKKLYESLPKRMCDVIQYSGNRVR